MELLPKSQEEIIEELNKLSQNELGHVLINASRIGNIVHA